MIGTKVGFKNFGTNVENSDNITPEKTTVHTGTIRDKVDSPSWYADSGFSITAYLIEEEETGKYFVVKAKNLIGKIPD